MAEPAPIDRGLAPQSQSRIVDQYRQRRGLVRSPAAMPMLPDPEPPDERRFGVIPVRSRALQQHERELHRIERTARRLQCAQAAGIALEVRGLRDSLEALDMCEGIVTRYEQDTLAATVGEEMLLDSVVDRLRSLDEAVQQAYRNEVLK